MGRATGVFGDYHAIGLKCVLDDLGRHHAIGYLNARLADTWPFGDDVAPPPIGRITANNGEAMRDLAIGGLGLALLPLFIVRTILTKGGVITVMQLAAAALGVFGRANRDTPLPFGVFLCAAAGLVLLWR